MILSQVCDGYTDCNAYHRSDYFIDNGLSDFSDEAAELCNNCTGPGLSLCSDQRTCIRDDLESLWCNGAVDCYDASDELAENCENCQKDDLFRCVFEGLDR